MTEVEKGILSDAIGIIKRIEKANGIDPSSSVLKPKRIRGAGAALRMGNKPRQITIKSVSSIPSNGIRVGT